MILNDLIGLKVFLILKTAPISSICKDNYYKSNLDTLKKLDYEHALVELAKTDYVYLNKIEDYAWTEIDDEQMLDRALSLIYPKIKQNEKI